VPLLVDFLHGLGGHGVRELSFDEHAVFVGEGVRLRGDLRRRLVLRRDVSALTAILALADVVLGVEVLADHDFIIIFIV